MNFGDKFGKLSLLFLKLNTLNEACFQNVYDVTTIRTKGCIFTKFRILTACGLNTKYNLKRPRWMGKNHWQKLEKWQEISEQVKNTFPRSRIYNETEFPNFPWLSKKRQK